jgi:osmotically-inducible protein OsmY
MVSGILATIPYDQRGRSMILQAQADAAIVTDSFTPSIDRSDTFPSDRDLQRRVHNFLRGRHVPLAPTITIEARNGAVTLRGTHRSYYHKQLCINCCLRVAGVVRLIDATKVVSDRD